MYIYIYIYICIYIYIYIYISAGPLAGPPGCEAFGESASCILCVLHPSLHPVSYVSCILHEIQPCSMQYPVCCILTPPSSLQDAGVWPGDRLLPPRDRVILIWDPPGEVPESIEISACHRDLPKHGFAPPGLQKAAKTTSKSDPPDPKLANNRKIQDPKKTSIFIRFFMHPAIGFSQYFHHQGTKKQALYTSLQFQHLKSRKTQKYMKNRLPRGP